MSAQETFKNCISPVGIVYHRSEPGAAIFTVSTMRRILTISCLVCWLSSGGASHLQNNYTSANRLLQVNLSWLGMSLEDVNKESVVKPPSFTGFRLINGPNIYKGSIPGLQGPIAVQNFVYTIEAANTGKYIIPGATTIMNGKLLKSNDIVIEVISPKDAALLYDKVFDGINSGYFLRPGEDPYERSDKIFS
jgi:hypothetical protein